MTDTTLKLPKTLVRALPPLIYEHGIALWELDIGTRRLSIYGQKHNKRYFGTDIQQLDLSWDEYLETRVHPEDRPGVVFSLDRALCENSLFAADRRVLDPETGTWLWHHVCGRLQVREDGSIVLCGWTLDVSEQVRLQETHEAIAAADQQVQDLFDASPLTCTLYDLNRVPIDCNLEAVRLFGMASKEEYLRTIVSYMPVLQPDGTDSQERWRSFFREVLKRGHQVIRWQHLTRDGAPIMLELTGLRIRIGEDERLVCYSRDLTPEARNNEKLNAAEERTRAMLDATPLACTLFDENCSPIDCNLEAVRIFGLRSRIDYLRRFNSLSPVTQPDGTDSYQGFLLMIRNAFASGKVVFDWMHCHADGTWIPVEVTLVRVKWREGYCVVGYTRDLRELRKTMAEIEATQDALRLARDEARASARAKTTFLANMSHEIRTPMNAIMGMTGIARESTSLERIQYCLGKIEDAAGHLLGVINDILDMSKIEAGKFEVSPVETVLDDLLARITNVVGFRVEQKRQSFIIRVNPDVPRSLVTDPQRLAQVITNLVTNAVKFTPDEGKIILFIRKRSRQGDLCELEFEVSDTGIGISPEQQERLFQSFEQADDSISRRFGGTGLGLSISKSIIEHMDGSIWVESEPGKGSRFFFTIWARVAENTRPVALSPGASRKKLRVLIVDDAPEICEYVEEILGGLGIACKTACDGYQALDMIRHFGAFDIVFIDWMMPEMDGLELARRIRALRGAGSIVILISSVDWAQVAAEAHASGINDFIPKPILSSMIVDCINRHVCAVAPDPRNGPDLATGGTGSGTGVGEPNPAPAPCGSDAPTPRRSADLFRGRRILVVEDIDINREILGIQLQETGVDIDCAVDGREALEMITAAPGRYDLILMDIHMPEMDGYEATRRIRALGTPDGNSLPIIAMTANVFREDVERCLAVGMDDHVGKPISVDEVIGKMARYLSDPRPRTCPRRPGPAA
ncbi:response regulator [Phaeovibrio sulfidiphilus]|uniref:histidine kinase n=1 Tax=Phaeovibrio sulfidiphilus TaxID=1220600 RepID=A0A8J6YWG2_9PROT|nr:PAS domain-containing hybrid sensor histidine kinase/response regulator [Phaeovibrio sulfidiphilus]MBE1236942.1 response regulator [Phaeovibrio sulfidiphilus]